MDRGCCSCKTNDTRKKRSKSREDDDSFWQSVVEKYRRRKCKLERREVDLRNRLQAMENQMPMLLMMSLMKQVQDKLPGGLCGSQGKKDEPKTQCYRNSSPSNHCMGINRTSGPAKKSVPCPPRNAPSDSGVNDCTCSGGEISIKTLESSDMMCIQALEMLTSNERKLKEKISELEEQEAALSKVIEDATQGLGLGFDNAGPTGINELKRRNEELAKENALLRERHCLMKEGASGGLGDTSKRLGSAIRECENCKTCRITMPQDLHDTAVYIKEAADLVEQRFVNEIPEKDVSAKPSVKSDESEKPSEIVLESPSEDVKDVTVKEEKIDGEESGLDSIISKTGGEESTSSAVPQDTSSSTRPSTAVPSTDVSEKDDVGGTATASAISSVPPESILNTEPSFQKQGDGIEELFPPSAAVRKSSENVSKSEGSVGSKLETSGSSKFIPTEKELLDYQIPSNVTSAKSEPGTVPTSAAPSVKASQGLDEISAPRSVPPVAVVQPSVRSSQFEEQHEKQDESAVGKTSSVRFPPEERILQAVEIPSRAATPSYASSKVSEEVPQGPQEGRVSAAESVRSKSMDVGLVQEAPSKGASVAEPSISAKPSSAMPSAPASALPSEVASAVPSTLPGQPPSVPVSSLPSEAASRPESALPSAAASRPESELPSEAASRPGSALPSETASRPESALPSVAASRPESALLSEAASAPASRPTTARPSTEIGQLQAAEEIEAAPCASKQPSITRSLTSKPSEKSPPESAVPTEPGTAPGSTPASKPASAQPSGEIEPQPAAEEGEAVPCASKEPSIKRSSSSKPSEKSIPTEEGIGQPCEAGSEGKRSGELVPSLGEAVEKSRTSSKSGPICDVNTTILKEGDDVDVVVQVVEGTESQKSNTIILEANVTSSGNVTVKADMPVGATQETDINCTESGNLEIIININNLDNDNVVRRKKICVCGLGSKSKLLAITGGEDAKSGEQDEAKVGGNSELECDCSSSSVEPSVKEVAVEEQAANDEEIKDEEEVVTSKKSSGQCSAKSPSKKSSENKNVDEENPDVTEGPETPAETEQVVPDPVEQVCSAKASKCLDEEGNEKECSEICSTAAEEAGSNPSISCSARESACGKPSDICSKAETAEEPVCSSTPNEEKQVESANEEPSQLPQPQETKSGEGGSSQRPEDVCKCPMKPKAALPCGCPATGSSINPAVMEALNQANKNVLDALQKANADIAKAMLEANKNFDALLVDTYLLKSERRNTAKLKGSETELTKE